jgi:hypothetical protein
MLKPSLVLIIILISASKKKIFEKIFCFLGMAAAHNRGKFIAQVSR